MKYTKQNNIHIIEVPIKDFKIILNDSKKKSASTKNYCNAGFFANYKSNQQPFTLPVAHLVCDYNATSSYTKKYCVERGKFNGNKFTFDSSNWSYQNSHYQKAISTLLVNDNKAEIKEVVSIPTGYNYAISGIPIIKNGNSVNFDVNIQSQGWDGSPLYGTWHIFIGLKKNSNIIYVIGMQTTTWNMVKTNEAYNKLKSLDMYNVIKLDGGGSFHMNVNGKAVASTSEDRRINTIICFNETVGTNKADNSTNKTNNTSNVEINSTQNNNFNITTDKTSNAEANAVKTENNQKQDTTNTNTNVSNTKGSAVIKALFKRKTLK